MLYFIYVSKKLVDIATGDSTGSIPVYSLILLSIVVIRLLVNALNTKLGNTTEAKLDFVIRQRIFNNLMRSKWFGKEKLHSGDTLNRLESDADKVASVICADFPTTVTTFFQLVSAFAFMSVLDFRLALILIILTPAFLGLSKLFFRKMRMLTLDIKNTESKVQSHIQESLQNRSVIRSLEQSDMMGERLSDLQYEEYGQILDRTRFNVFSTTLIGATFGFGYAAALLWGIYGIHTGTVTFGIMTAFLQLVGQIQGPTVKLTKQIPSFAYATASIDRLMEIESFPKERKGKPVHLDGIAGVRIENLSFRYPDSGRYVIKNLSFDFRPSSRTAIVGETGIGKSTLIKIILSLLSPSEGHVLLYTESGMEIEASPQTRNNLVYVPQGNTLFSGTIRENLLMGNPSAGESELDAALRIAVAEFVNDLPDGLDTVCGESGAGLSEGQAQRIAIARGLLRPGSILLLDEFSSSLDPQTEDRLMSNLTSATIGDTFEKTMIFITHREKISLYCDNILKMENQAI
jgi:ABC-type multidrug transport system fused ATPase/permease subunit